MQAFLLVQIRVGSNLKFSTVTQMAEARLAGQD